jgi:hypothetical protein
LNFGRRLLLYFFGFFLGGLIVWFGIMKDRPSDPLTSWLPKNRIIMQLDTNKLVLTKLAECRMHCQGLAPEEIKEVIRHGDVNFGMSEVHAKPFQKYAIEGITKRGQKMRIICVAHPAETEIITTFDLGQKADTCSCK